MKPTEPKRRKRLPKSADPFYLSPAWRALRLRALKRDRYRCVMCGSPVTGPRKARIDHVIPRRKRPDLSLVLSNIRTLCTRCDGQRHADKGRRDDTFGSRPDGTPIDPAHPWRTLDHD